MNIIKRVKNVLYIQWVFQSMCMAQQLRVDHPGPYAGVVWVVPKNPLAGLEVAVFCRETTDPL